MSLDCDRLTLSAGSPRHRLRRGSPYRTLLFRLRKAGASRQFLRKEVLHQERSLAAPSTGGRVYARHPRRRSTVAASPDQGVRIVARHAVCIHADCLLPWADAVAMARETAISRGAIPPPPLAAWQHEAKVALVTGATNGVTTTLNEKEVAMNQDQMKGDWKQLKGRVKEQWGKLTDDDLTQVDGQRDQLVGKLQEKYGIAKEEAQKQVKEFEGACC